MGFISKRKKNNILSNTSIEREFASEIVEILEEKLEDNNISSSDRLEITRKVLNLGIDSKEIKWQEFNISKWRVREKNIDTQKLFNEVIELENKAYEEELERDIAKSKLDKSDDDYVYKKEINKDEIYIVDVKSYATGVDLWSIGKITDNGTKYTEINEIN